MKLRAIATVEVGHHPGRAKPRAIKCRPKPRDPLKGPHDQERKRLMRNA